MNAGMTITLDGLIRALAAAAKPRDVRLDAPRGTAVRGEDGRRRRSTEIAQFAGNEQDG